MSKQITVWKGRYTIKLVHLHMDVSADTFTSQIRERDDVSSPLIAEWDVSFEDDGTDGVLRLTLDDSVTGLITQSTGFMDIKRVTGGQPVSVMDECLMVKFLGVTTE